MRVLEIDVLALDLSMTRTGWAMSHGYGDYTYSGFVSFPVTDKEFPCARFAVFAAWLETRIRDYPPSLIVFEENTGRGFDAEALIGLKMRLLEICANHRIPTKSIYPTTLKKFFAGDARADKNAMKAEAARRYSEYDSENDQGGDIADSLALLSWWKAGCPPSQAQLDRERKAEIKKAAKKAAKQKETSTR